MPRTRLIIGSIAVRSSDNTYTNTTDIILIQNLYNIYTIWEIKNQYTTVQQL